MSGASTATVARRAAYRDEEVGDLLIGVHRSRDHQPTCGIDDGEPCAGGPLAPSKVDPPVRTSRSRRGIGHPATIGVRLGWARVVER